MIIIFVLHLIIEFYAFEMSSFTNLCDIHDWMKESEGLMLIKKFMEFGALPKEGQYPCQKCGHIMILVERNNVADKFKWCCKNVIKPKKKKQFICNYTVSIRTETFFARSHLTLGEIAKFICCWAQNMQLKTICNETRISSRTAVDFANLCREVVYIQLVHTSKPI